MRLYRRIPLILVAMTIATAGLIGQSAGASTAPTYAVLHANLTAAQEVAGGQAGGTGQATFTLNSVTGTVCYVIIVQGIAAPTAAHIHKGDPGVNGPVVIPLPLTPGVTNTIAGCTTTFKAKVQNIIDDPDAYYTNVHNVVKPGGAVRGQLSTLP